jgi:Glycosyltransferases involved in cell wall biogenesis
MNNLLIVIPCFNEEEVINETTHKILNFLDFLVDSNKITNGNILYVDDGSKDSTWTKIEYLHNKYSNVSGIKLSHNVGHQKALWVGLSYAAEKCDAVITIDADLQDDIGTIEQMVDLHNKNIDVVYGARNNRDTDSIFKRITAQLFYKFMIKMGVELEYNHADFRLLSQRALKALLSYPEKNLFLRGLVKTIGFPSATVYYERHERYAGESKYPFFKMVNFAIDGITSFSVKPLRIVFFIGFLLITISLIGIIWGLISFFTHNAIPGWTSLMVSIWFIGGCILSGLGIIGEYIGKIYIETKRRPLYFIEKEII